MKNKLILALTALLALTASCYAFTPVFGGENLYTLTSPELLSGSGSATGGPIFRSVPASIVLNPAIPAREQQNTLNLSYLAMIDTKKPTANAEVFGTGIQLGATIPTNLFVYSGTIQWIMAPFERMNLGNTINMHLGASKNINDHLDVGLNIYAGYFGGKKYGHDWNIGADVGILYLLDDIGVIKEPRLGISVVNLGKPVTNCEVYNVKGTTEGSTYPGILTPKVGFSSLFVKNSDVKAGFSTDFSFPTCKNIVADLAVGFEYKDMVDVDIAWEALDLVEYLNGAKIKWPSLGVNLKFTINTGKIAKISNDWEKSEICPSVAATNLYSGIVAVAAGASIELGLQDSTAPEIIVWNGEGLESETAE